MKEIKLTQGKVALVDDEDFDRVMNAGKWYVLKSNITYYAVKNTPRINGKQKKISLHTFILGTPEDGYEIDHKDNNGLNCIKDNLRFVTHQQNIMNKSKTKNCTSIYKGVYYYKRDNTWRAHININEKHFYLGAYEDEKLAACAYNAKALELFGEYASLNTN